MLGVRPAKSDVVVALHPVTRSVDETEVFARALVRFCQDFAGRVFLSTPNGDPGSEAIQQAWQSLVKQSPHCLLFPSMGAKVFRGLVAACGALVGNSSAGIWEAPSLGTPSLDCGTRQSGRIRGNTVWGCGVDEADALAAKVQHLLSPQVQASCRQAVNPYGDGNAVPRILDAIGQYARVPHLKVKC
jgi:UDP-N-acetylglucosamine 2-epimerase